MISKRGAGRNRAGSAPGEAYNTGSGGTGGSAIRGVSIHVYQYLGEERAATHLIGIRG